MTKLEEQVAEFHRVFGHGIRETPGLPPEDRIRFHLSLITEEFTELLEAVLPEDDWVHLRAWIQPIIRSNKIRVDMPALADACGDLDYVVQSLRTAMGIKAEPIADAIHAANMAKAVVCSICMGRGKEDEMGGHLGNPTRPCRVCKGAGRIVKKRDADGKVIKPEGWTPPDITGELRKQGWISNPNPLSDGIDTHQRLKAIAERKGLTVDALLYHLEEATK